MELAQPDSGLPDFDFPENVALALAVCREIGVDRDRALEGILRYQPDPYALSLFRLPSGAAFVNAMSVNDPQSTQLDYHRVAGRPGMVGRRLVLLINNRPDRGYRTEHMMMVARGLEPEEIWLIGASPAGGAPHPAAHPAGHTCPAVSWSGGTALGQPGGGHYDLCRWKLGRPG